VLSRKTVFVVGAGASYELGLPIGEGLKPKIVEALKVERGGVRTSFVNDRVDEAVGSYVEEADRSQQVNLYAEFIEAAGIISRALPFALSIDQYLDSQQDNPTIVRLGKIGIAAAILKAERESAIGANAAKRVRVQDNGITTEALGSWHMRLVQLLTAGVSRSNISSIFDEVGFIVFNYDRCIERYLSIALSRYYNTSGSDLDAAMGSLEIIHPYGKVGRLEWQQGGPHIRFGGEGEGYLRKVAESILTFTESADTGVTDEVQRLIAGAETVVFMGFGFLPQNVELLHPHRGTAAVSIFYTTYGISDTDAKLIVNDLDSMFDPMSDVALTDRPYDLYEERGTCSDLMRNNWMMLTR
jgi:hypothetical protein